MIKAITGTASVIRHSLEPSNWWFYQYAYGHREILLAYADLPAAAYFRGDIQHGWSIGHDTRVARTLDPWGREAWGWVWEPEAAAAAMDAGCRRKIAIGSPWLYMLAISRIRPAWESARTWSANGQILFIPTHHHPSPVLLDRHGRQAIRLRDEYGSDSVVVMLAMSDYLQREVRRSYECVGIRVTTAGNTGYPYRFPVPATQDFGDRVRFLWNIRDALLNVDLVVTNGVGSHVFYAASLGLPVVVWPYSEAEQERLPLGDGTAAGREEYRRILLYERDVLGIAEEGPVDNRTLLREARSKLGADAFCSPEQLKSKLHWDLLTGPGPFPTVEASWATAATR